MWQDNSICFQYCWACSLETSTAVSQQWKKKQKKNKNTKKPNKALHSISIKKITVKVRRDEEHSSYTLTCICIKLKLVTHHTQIHFFRDARIFRLLFLFRVQHQAIAFPFMCQAGGFECAAWLWNNERRIHINAPWWLKRRLERESCSALAFESAWALRKVCVCGRRGWLSVTEDLTSVSSQRESEKERYREREREREKAWRRIERSGWRKRPWEGWEDECGGRDKHRQEKMERSGGAPRYTWRIRALLRLLAIKPHASVFRGFYERLGGNISLWWLQVCGWNESSQLHCTKNKSVFYFAA